MAEKPTFAFVGDMSGPLAQAVAPQVALVPFTDTAATSRTGVLVDGAAAEPGARVLEQVLESGEILAVAKPNPKQRQSLLAMAGAGPATEVPLVTYLPSPNGQGFSCNLVPAPGTLTSYRADESGVHSFGPEPIPPLDVGEQLIQVAAASAALPEDPGWVTGFVPPAGSTAGYHSRTTPMKWPVPYPQNSKQEYDDRTVQKNNQEINGSLVTEFYVYWVDGAIGSENPYFVVIVRQTGLMGIGAIRGKNVNSRGYFQFYFRITPNGFAGIKNGLSIDKYVPTSASNGQGFRFSILGYGPLGKDGKWIWYQLFRSPNPGRGTLQRLGCPRPDLGEPELLAVPSR